MEQKSIIMRNFNLRTMLLLAVLLGNIVFVFADDTKIWQDKIEYTITDEGVAYVSDANANITTAIIPESITVNEEEYQVTIIGSSAFESCSKLSSVTIPKTVRKIGNSAFSRCSSLTSVNIPRSVKTIGREAFREAGLTELFIPATVNQIGGACCEDCKNLKKCILEDSDNPITIPGVGSDYGTRALFCNYLEELYMGRNLKDSVRHTMYDSYLSDRYAFNIPSLRKVTFGPKVTRYVDIYDSSVEELYLPDNIQGILSVTLRKLKKIFVGNGITQLSVDAGDSLTHVYTGNNLERLIIGGHQNRLEYIVITSHKLKYFYRSAQEREILLLLPQKDMYPNLMKDCVKNSIGELIGQTKEYTGEVPSFNFSTKVSDAEFSVNSERLSANVGNYKEYIPITMKVGDWTSSFTTEASYEITPAPLTVIADDKEIQFGEETPEFTCSYFGFKNDEDESVLKTPVTISTTAKKNSPAGTYPIIPFGGVADNYTLSYERGTLTIDKASQTIDWTVELPSTAEVGTKVKLAATASSGLPVLFKSSNDDIANVSIIDDVSYLLCKKVGDVVVTAYQSGNKNYEECTAGMTKAISITQPNGITEIRNATADVKDIYSVDGCKLRQTKRGINIIRSSDGKTKKVFVHK